jgi:hypothetical protein
VLIRGRFSGAEDEYLLPLDLEFRAIEDHP